MKEKSEDEYTDDEGVLSVLNEGQVFELVAAFINEHFTSHTKSYTEVILLSAIIESLVSDEFVKCKDKKQIPTKAGINLITVLSELLASPKLTVDWKQMEVAGYGFRHESEDGEVSHHGQRQSRFCYPQRSHSPNILHQRN